MTIKRSRGRAWSRFHFLIRFLGLTGLLCAGVGVGLTFLEGVLDREHLFNTEFLRSTLLGENGAWMLRIGVTLLAGGAVLAAVALLVEVLGIGRAAAGRRGAFGFNAAVQVGLAGVLLIGINWFSAQHHLRLDWTRNHLFTLPKKIQERLSHLKGQTTIVVYQQHKTFGHGDDQAGARENAAERKPYYSAAERKVVEKVKDLVEQFREYGPQFKVVVLDVEEKGFSDKLKELAADSPALKRAIDGAPENSIFFQAEGKASRLSFKDAKELEKIVSGPAKSSTLDMLRDLAIDAPGLREALDRGVESSIFIKVAGKVERLHFEPGATGAGKEAQLVLFTNEDAQKLSADSPALREAIADAPENSIVYKAASEVQRLSFNDFYDLDMTASRKEGNLVLLNQGVWPFARKVLNINEKRPRVGVLVIHEVLTTLGPQDFGMSGLKKSLEDRGFDVRDIILRNWQASPPEHAVFTFDENKLTRLEDELAEMDADIKNFETGIQQLQKAYDFWKSSKLEDLTKKYESQLRGRKITEPMRSAQLEEIDGQKRMMTVVLAQYREEQKTASNEKVSLERKRETAEEERRMTDLQAKLGRMLADCDMILIPHMTIRNLVPNERIPSGIYQLDNAQVAAIKDFVKSGKPILACFGPANEQASDRMMLTQMGLAPPPDKLELMLGQLGIKFGAQTVLYNVQSKSFAERRSGLLVSGAAVDVPTVEFSRKAGPAGPLSRQQPSYKQENPLSASMSIASRSLGQALDLQVRYPRPIYYETPPGGKSPTTDPVFMWTSAATWNEDQPFPTPERTPRYEPPKPEDPTIGTAEEKRRGPFPIAVAVEAPVPEDWFGSNPHKPTDVRVAVIGNGGIFNGPELSAAKEELLVDTTNWLLGRDDLLPRADNVWSYPRAELTPKSQTVWRWATMIGLPGIFAYLGLVVLMIRRLR